MQFPLIASVVLTTLVTSDDALAAGDLALAGGKFDVLQAMLAHPILTAIAAGAAWYTIPRIVAASIRYLIVPATLFMLGWLCVEYPEQTSIVLTSLFKLFNEYPVQMSSVILVVVGVLLVPSLVAAAGGLATVVTLSHFVFHTDLPALPEIKPTGIFKSVTGAVNKGAELQKQLGAVTKNTGLTSALNPTLTAPTPAATSLLSGPAATTMQASALITEASKVVVGTVEVVEKQLPAVTAAAWSVGEEVSALASSAANRGAASLEKLDEQLTSMAKNEKFLVAGR